MGIDISRLRPGEIIAGASAVLLLVLMFAVPWYGVKSTFSSTATTLGVSTSINGWNSLSHLRWLLLLTIIVTLALAYYQASRQAPAIPVTLSVIVTVLGLLSTLALIYRVLINVPGSNSVVDARVGAYLGLLCAVGILYGGFASMRREGISPQDAPSEIETIRTGQSGGS
jgi:hypothetical protein